MALRALYERALSNMREVRRQAKVFGWVRDLVGQLPEELRAQAERVRLEVRELPTPTDLERGAEPDLRGYFYGDPLQLAETGDGTGTCDDHLAVLPDDSGVAPLIVLFWGNISPLTPDNVGTVFMHEFGHRLGYDEQELVEGLGLA